jgi:hypothetical protein
MAERRNSQESQIDEEDEKSLSSNDGDDEQATIHTEPSEATDEDWLQEVIMNPAATRVAHSPDDLLAAAWSTDTTPNAFDNDTAIASDEQPPTQQQQQSKWFRSFLRHSKSHTTRSRLPSAEDGDGLWLEPSTSTTTSLEDKTDNTSKWLDPSWFLQELEVIKPNTTETALPPMLQHEAAANSADGGGGFKHNTNGWFLPRARLCTESTIPMVATDEEEEEEDFSQDFVQGMEHNLDFLNI